MDYVVTYIISFFVASVGAIAVNADFFNEGNGPVILNSVTCNGNESSLLDCSHVVGENFRCPTSGVVCQGKLEVLHGPATSSIIYYFLFHCLQFI